MEVNSNAKYSYLYFQTRWRNSINQLSKLEQESKISKFDTIYKRTSSLKLKMKNRLGQIDDSFFPVLQNHKSAKNNPSEHNKIRVASTNHDTNIFTIGSDRTEFKLQESLIIGMQEPNPEQQQKFIYKCHQIRQEIIEELTEYNNSRYSNQMNINCSKYNQSLKSVFYAFIDHPKKEIYRFCYNCDQILSQEMNLKKQNQIHNCRAPLTSISRVQQALIKIQNYVKNQNNKIFHIFLHNALQLQTNIEQLISNVSVLKQSLDHQYEPEQAVLRLRLMNLIGKKIGLLIEQKELQNRLLTILSSKR